MRGPHIFPQNFTYMDNRMYWAWEGDTELEMTRGERVKQPLFICSSSSLTCTLPELILALKNAE